MTSARVLLAALVACASPPLANALHAAGVAGGAGAPFASLAAPPSPPPQQQRTGGSIFNVLGHGAVGDGVHNDTGAIRAALAAARKAGGGIVLLPAPHTFLSGSLHMESHTIFRIEAGATLLGSTIYTDYPHELVPGGLNGNDTRQRQSLIAGAACHHEIQIDADGVEGGGCASWAPLVNVTLDGGGE
jgi:polygalacturonase